MRPERSIVYYAGSVQGVGFRYTVKQIAMGYDVCGTVRNESDGRVKLTVEGDRDEVEAFLDAIRESDLGVHIRDVQTEWADALQNIKGFEIVS